MLIVGVVFGSLYMGVGFAFDVTRFERENLRATQVILRRMEGIRLFNWLQITDTTLNPTNFSDAYIPGSSVTNFYVGKLSVADVVLDPPVSYSNLMKKLTVTVSWQSNGRLRTRTASTYIARDGVQNYVYLTNSP
jgi:hypothetical protein